MVINSKLVAKIVLAMVFIVYCIQEYLSFVGSLGYQPQLFREKMSQYDVEVVRDEFGVPSIFGETDTDVAFGVGYVMAEDRLEDIEEGLKLYRAERGYYEGKDGLESDYIIGLLGVWDWIESGEAAGQLDAQMLELLQAYADGVNAYAGIDVNRATKSLYPMTVEDMLAGFYLQHLFFYGFDDQLRSDIQNPMIDGVASVLNPTNEPIGSNAMAVSGTLTDSGDTFLFWNSHQPLQGPVAWYEAGIYSGEGWTFHGGFFPGSPVPFIGTSPTLSWGVTVNRPDLVDVFKVAQADLAIRDCQLSLKLFGALSLPITKDCYSFEGLPVLELEDGFYAINYAGRGEFRQIEQWYELSHTQNLTEWLNVFQNARIASFNFVVADHNGEIAFLHNAMMPSERKAEPWSAYHDFRMLPQRLNPSTGYVASVNQGPQDMVTDINEVIAPYVESHSNNRSLRVHELMNSLGSINWSEFMAIKYDHFYSTESEQYAKLRTAIATQRSSTNPEYIDHLEAWDGGTDRENVHATLALCVIESESDQDSINHCASRLIDTFGRYNLPWGVVNRLVEGGNYWAVSGAPDVLRAMYPDQEDYDQYGIRRIVAGDGLHGFVRYRNGQLVEATVISPYGQSIAKRSAHRVDQAEMFSHSQLRSLSFDANVIYQNAARVYRPSESY